MSSPDRLLVVLIGAVLAIVSLWLGIGSGSLRHFALAASFALFTVFWYLWLPAGIFSRRKQKTRVGFRAMTRFEAGTLIFGIVLLFISIGAQLLGG